MMQRQHGDVSSASQCYAPQSSSSPSVPTLAVLGTMSDAGKSIIAAGICRIFANHGIRVAPFKGQNMSNNAAPALLPSIVGNNEMRTTTNNSNPSTRGDETMATPNAASAYGEIGTAQALQARACRILPRVEMNPVLLKSGGRREKDGAYLASVFVLGKQIACEDFGSLGQRCKNNSLMDCVQSAHEQLVQSTQAQVVVLEGAGSCTELNLMDRDIVNLPLVRRLHRCSWILVANIDCGGVFAQIVGTKACLPSSDWDACVAIVVNKLRGEVKYFEPGPLILQEMVGKPVYVVPYLYNLNLAEEDGLGVERRLAQEWIHAKNDHNDWSRVDMKLETNTSRKDEDKNIGESVAKPRIVVIAYPHVSMADELASVEADERFTVQWRRDSKPPPYPNTTTVILPGSRLTRSDLQWLHDTGWSDWIQHHVDAGGSVVGLCGGYQMLGQLVEDDMGVEGPTGRTNGLGLLPVRTVILPPECKRVTPRVAHLLPYNNCNSAENEPIRVEGFELHCGETKAILPESHSDEGNLPKVSPLLRFADDDDGELEGCSRGRVKGTYLHGILGSAQVRRQLLAPDWDFGRDSEGKDGSSEDDDLDRFAHHLEACGLTFDTLSKWVDLNV